MKMRFLGVLLVSILIAFPVTAQGSIPMLINHQGRLMSPDMAPIVGAETIKFTIYDHATTGNELWSETHTVSLQEGYYSVLLGSQTDLTYDVFDKDEVFLGISVSVDEEVKPRFRVSSTPYSMFAGEAATVGGLGSTDISNMVANHNHDERYYTRSQLSASGGGSQVHWGNLVGVPAIPAMSISDAQISQWSQAYGWGNHTLAGYLKSYSETDPVFIGSPAHGITASLIAQWSQAYGWGNHTLAGYLKSYSETDPVFINSVAHGITSTQVGQWSQAYGWGNHAASGYLKSETDTLASVTDRGASTSKSVTLSGGASFPHGIWTSSGNVGIGTRSPTGLLTLSSSTEPFPVRINTSHDAVTGILLGNSGAGGKTYAINSTANGATVGGGFFAISDRDASEYRFLINKTGNVGIGVTNPTEKLHLLNGKVTLGFNNNANLNVHRYEIGAFSSKYGSKEAAKIAVLNYNSTGSGWYHQYPERWKAGLSFYTMHAASQLEAVTITSSGKVGVGTASPKSALHVGTGYIQLPLTSGSPPASDCDSATEHGRMKVDATGGKLWICMASGWVAK